MINSVYNNKMMLLLCQADPSYAYAHRSDLKRYLIYLNLCNTARFMIISGDIQISNSHILCR